MAKSIRATTTLEGNSVTLVAATVGPPPPPPLKLTLTRRGATVTIKKGTIDITIDIPANASKPVMVNARGRAVCNGPARPAKAKPSGGGKTRASKTTAKGTVGPPPGDH